MLYLKIFNTFFWKMIYAPYSELFQELKYDIDILEGQVVFKLWTKTVKTLFWLIAQEQLGLLKF